MLSVTHIMPVLVFLLVMGVGMQQWVIQNHHLIVNTELTPTKYWYVCRYAAYNKQF